MIDELTVCAILGAANNEAGCIDSDAIQRCELAIEILFSNTQAKLILCGGFGEHFNISEKHHYRYLQKFMESKIEKIGDRILGCVDSYNTIDDIQGINNILNASIGQNFKLIIITNDYHVLRSSVLAKNIIQEQRIRIQFLSVSTLYDNKQLNKRLDHEVGGVKEYFSVM